AATGSPFSSITRDATARSSRANIASGASRVRSRSSTDPTLRCSWLGLNICRKASANMISPAPSKDGRSRSCPGRTPVCRSPRAPRACSRGRSCRSPRPVGPRLAITEPSLPEGPFGEFTGYYAAEKRPAPVMQVEAMHWRHDPILLGSPPMKPPRFHFGLPFRAAGIWADLERAGVTDVVGAWQHVAQLMTVIALKQRYAGHAKRAGLIAAAQSYMGRLVVTVDDDVDPSDLADVMWAITTRCEPAESVDIVRHAWSSALDPRITADARRRGETSHSKMIVDACKPFAWKEAF